MDQLRVDVLCDILLTGHATTVDIDRDGGEGNRCDPRDRADRRPDRHHDRCEHRSPRLASPGTDPSTPESARRIAATATIWDRVLTDPATGNIQAVDRRFPTEAQRRFLRARDEHCRFPGAGSPRGGATWTTPSTISTADPPPCNLAHLCRRHHSLKHQTAWQVEQHLNGELVWTSPLGRSYTDTPPATLRFIPTPDNAR